MILPGSARPPRSCLDRGTRNATTGAEMEAMRAAAWHRHGVAATRVTTSHAKALYQVPPHGAACRGPVCLAKAVDAGVGAGG